MKTELIKQIKELETVDNSYYNDAINDVLKIINTLPEPIRAKALRKQGTVNIWYYWVLNADEWMEWTLPNLLQFNTEEINIYKVPPDAELVDIEIYIKPKT